MATLLRELRLAARRLLRAPLPSAIAVLALALGIGLTTSMYSIAYGVLFRGLPYPDSESILFLTRTDRETGAYQQQASFLDFLDWRERQSSFEDLATYSQRSVSLSDDADRPERVSAAWVSPSLFPILRVPPALGRGFQDDETGPGHAVVVISDALWQSRYGSDPAMVGRTLRADGETYTIVGVMPPGFAFPEDQVMWFPYPQDPTTLGRADLRGFVVGRLAPSTTRAAAEAEMSSVVAQLAREFPETNRPASVAAQPISRIYVGDDDRALLGTMITAGFFVLVMACANVANLLMARAMDRSRELAIATALGAGRGRILAQLLLEVGVLAAVGAALGVGLAHLYVTWFSRALSAVGIPLWLHIEVDGPVLLFTLGVSALATLLAGLVPAWRAAGVSVHEVLQDESRGASSLRMGRWSRGMVVLAISLAFPLLVGAGLMLRSLGAAVEDQGFDSGGFVTVSINLPQRDYPEPGDRRAFWDRMVEWTSGAPGVQGVTWSDALPGAGTGTRWIEVEGEQYLRDQDRPRVRVAGVRPGFFETLGVSALRGRVLETSDRDGPPVVVINQAMARRWFPGVDPVGRRVRVQDGADNEYRTVVGVVPDVRMNGSNDAIPEGLYLSAPPAFVGGGHLLVRMEGDPLALAPAIRRQVAAMDPELPVIRIATLDARIREVFWIVRLLGKVFALFGVAALFLAAVGLYGVMAHSVAQRTRELGVRRALGAEPAGILRLVLTWGLRQVAMGIVLGSVLSLLVSRALVSALYQVEPRDPATFVGVAAVLVATGVLAVLVPAVRAMRLDPVAALRWE